MRHQTYQAGVDHVSQAQPRRTGGVRRLGALPSDTDTGGGATCRPLPSERLPAALQVGIVPSGQSAPSPLALLFNGLPAAFALDCAKWRSDSDSRHRRQCGTGGLGPRDKLEPPGRVCGPVVARVAAPVSLQYIFPFLNKRIYIEYIYSLS